MSLLRTGPVTGLLVVASLSIVAAEETAATSEWKIEHRLKTTISAPGAIAGLLVSPDGEKVAFGNVGTPGTVQIWDAKTGKLLAKVIHRDFYVGSIAFSPDGTKLAIGDYDVFGNGTIQVVDASDGKVETTVATPGRWSPGGSALAFSPDGKRVATTAGQYKSMIIQLWDLSTEKVVATLGQGLETLDSFAFSPDGATIAIASEDLLRLWNVSTGDVLSIAAPAAQRFAYAAAFSPDGKTVVGGCCDGALREWDATSLALVKTLPKAFEPAKHHSLAVTAAGSIFCMEESSLATNFRDPKTGQVRSKIVHEAACVDVSRDGKTVAMLDGNSDVLVWRYEGSARTLLSAEVAGVQTTTTTQGFAGALGGDPPK
jgi:WD40 repeat protein